VAQTFHGLISDREDIHNVAIRWHWLLHSLIKLVGPQVVYDVGLSALGYPPTWVDTHSEADTVESAVFEFLRGRYNV
jgi:hypothetical protein